MHPETDTLKEVLNSSKNPELMIGLIALVAKVYTTPDKAEEFLNITSKMMEDEAYLPDKMIEMPGDHPEAENTLREVMDMLLGRRI